MPTYRSITLALHSQFDIETIPEYYPHGREQCAQQDITCSFPQALEVKNLTCNVYIPTLPGSIFWIRYCISPPVPEGHYFLFKLYINGVEIMGWSTSKEEGWTGKTMFGLYEKIDDEGRKRVEKRVLCFAPPDRKDQGCEGHPGSLTEGGCLEIKVCRAHGRRRVERNLELYESTQHARSGEGISLANAGLASRDQPKRFYQFALIDPVDQPFATFKYHYRTWTQLYDMGLLDDGHQVVAEDNALSIIEPEDADRAFNKEILQESRDAKKPLTDEKTPRMGALSTSSTMSGLSMCQSPQCESDLGESEEQSLLLVHPTYVNGVEKDRSMIRSQHGDPNSHLHDTKRQKLAVPSLTKAVTSAWKRWGHSKRQT